MLFQKYAQRSTKALKIKNKFVRNRVRKSNKKTEKSLVNVVFTRLFIWQGQKGSNPRHAVLETAALPTELYPYKNSLILVGHQGLEPRTDRL